VLYGVYGSFVATGVAEGGVAHPYLINDNNIDRIIYYAKSLPFKYSGVINSRRDRHVYLTCLFIWSLIQ